MQAKLRSFKITNVEIYNATYLTCLESQVLIILSLKILNALFINNQPIVLKFKPQTYVSYLTQFLWIYNTAYLIGL